MRKICVVTGSRADLIRRINNALEFLAAYSEIDGEHHKNYYVTEATSELLGDEELFESWLESHPNWEEGIAP